MLSAIAQGVRFRPVRLLLAYLEERNKQNVWKTYTAQMLWYANHALYRGEFKYPTWLDIVEPKPQDNRTGRQIIDDLVEQLRARQEKRKAERRGKD